MCRRSPTATPFQTPAWLVSWWRAFAPGRLHAVAAWEGGSLVVYGRKDAEINLKKQFVIDAKEAMTITLDRGDDGPGEFKLDAKDQIEIKAGTKIVLEGNGETQFQLLESALSP